ncbi:MAG: penicillin-insensitive murein endopeptidase [Labilithrix sp.]
MMAVRTSLVILAGLLVAPMALAGPPPPKPAQPGHPAHPAHAAHPAHGHLKTAKLAETPRRDKPMETPKEAPKPAPGRSVGSPTAGKLIGGAHLSDSDHVRVVPSYAPGDSRWGLEALVSMIDRAAKAVKKQWPDAQLSIGHLSRQGGGEIDRHASHESGRDADIGFYVRNQQGKTIYADHFVTFKGDGTAPSWPGAQFDDAKNWQLVTSFVSDVNAHVTHIFVASPIRARLLAYAEKIGAPAAVRTRAAELMAQPRGSLPHDDHFHVRVACPPGTTDLATNKCIEIPLPHHGKGGKSALANAHQGKPHAAPAAPIAKAPAKPGPATPATPATPSKEKDDDSAESKNDFLPSLAPSIPGLDSAVIPKALGGSESKEEKKSDADKALEPLPPIDDPDGVYENH